MAALGWGDQRAQEVPCEAATPLSTLGLPEDSSGRRVRSEEPVVSLGSQASIQASRGWLLQWVGLLVGRLVITQIC